MPKVHWNRADFNKRWNYPSSKTEKSRASEEERERKKNTARENRRSKKFSAWVLNILNIHDTKVFGVMSYNYMFLALYSLKRFFFVCSFPFLVFTSFSCSSDRGCLWTLCFFFFSLLLSSSLLLRFIQIAFRDVAFMLRFSVLTRRFCCFICSLVDFMPFSVQLLRPQPNLFHEFWTIAA